MGWHERTTLHGLRAAYRSWGQDATNFDYEALERCLAHTTRDSYRRGDLLDKRRIIMQAWGDYCLSEKAEKVVQLRG